MSRNAIKCREVGRDDSHGKARGIADEDMVACAKEANLSAARAKAIIGEVRDAVARWLEFADTAEVRPAHARQIADRLSRDS